MVRKQNERTLLLQYRIIPLSLPTNSILSYFSTPCPLSSRLGAFLSPKHFPANFFRNFFQSDQGDFFLYFWCEKLCFLGANFFLLLWREKLWGWRALVAPRMGGVSLFYASSPLFLGAPFCPSFPAFLVANFQTIVANFQMNRVKRGKSKDIFARFGVFSGFSETKKGKN